MSVRQIKKESKKTEENTQENKNKKYTSEGIKKQENKWNKYILMRAIDCERTKERGSIIITNKKSKGKHCRSKQNIMWDKWLLVRCAKLLLQAKYK